MKAEYLIYFCNDFDSVYDSQVLDLLISINARKVFKKVYLFQGIRTELQKQEFKKKVLPKEIGVVFYKSYPNYPNYNSLIRKQISKAIKSNNMKLEESILHTRGELLAWHLKMIINEKYHKNIFPDVRGAIIDELIEFRKMIYLLKYLKLWNYKKALKCLTEMKQITVVSETLKKYLVNKYNVNRNNISVIPCLAGENFKFDLKQRLIIRKELNVNQDDILIVFSSGGLSLWQNNEVLRTLADNDIKILNLSKNKIEHKNIINQYVEYSKVPLYLNASDIAIIWRENSIVNQVASPVKFSEYICCGLPIIANDSVNIIANYIKANTFGLLINNFDEINKNKINELLSLSRQKISDNGIKEMGVENISDKYLKLYSSILSC